jgi:hypothetical protein
MAVSWPRPTNATSGEMKRSADMNWDIDAGAPSFVTDPPSNEMKRDPSRLEVFKDYVRNIARWLGARAEHDASARENGDVRAPRSAALAEG